MLIGVSFLLYPPVKIESTEQTNIKAHETSLLNIWDLRKDLQYYFPDKKNGIEKMEGWTLTQWAEQFGYKEYKGLKKYNEDHLKEYIYEKYLPVETALMKISETEYDTENYDCKNFTMDLKKELEKSGISSISITGFPDEKNKTGHRWLAIEFEPISGEILKTNDYNWEFPKQQLTKNFLVNDLIR